ncbi:interleukin-12 receptor subunit beta-2 isoform X2 [Denticeps clupeoides]|uniref:interleukin-12 receptor subunit beta-2 isoform X2 n=1 Tax=Denticeps clupeoides TaxID=299321 RepID=UPI0010A3A875|nr:interleukin-12 receptor subunit beta-2-like isoform X2 [Denticeps clupeoides]
MCADGPLFLLLLAAGSCHVMKSCRPNSSAGTYVLQGSSFNITCVFEEKCQRGRASVHQDTNVSQVHRDLNSSSIMHEVTNIQKNTTYTCKCAEPLALCGMDVFSGYPPDVPQNLTCEQNGEFGVVNCTWQVERKSKFWTESKLCVRTASGNTAITLLHTAAFYSTFLLGSESAFSVWVNASNVLGFRLSAVHNYTLDDIVRPSPPVLVQVMCSSNHCHGHVNDSDVCRLLRIRYRELKRHCSTRDWSTRDFSIGSDCSWSVGPLKPYTVYELQAMGKLGTHRGQWSHWGTTVQKRTEEEAPSEKLVVWVTEDVPHSHYLHWKELSESGAKGRIQGYNVTVTNQTYTWNWKVKNGTCFGPLTCSHCSVSVSAYNSKGSSPPAKFSMQRRKGPPPQNVSLRSLDNCSIAISWLNTSTAGHHSLIGYVVEWLHPSRPKMDLQWQRVGQHQHSVIITDLQPLACYKGAVHALYEDGSGKSDHFDFSTEQMVPMKGPDKINTKPLDSTVTVSWNEISWNQSRGCLRKYTIYVNSMKYDVTDVKRRVYTLPAIVPGQRYDICVTAWTDAGEGPKGCCDVYYKQKLEQPDLTFGILAAVIFFLLCFGVSCLMQELSFSQRVSTCCHLMPVSIPDPANSKWAKECAAVNGDMTLNLYLSDSSMSEEEPDTVEVQEVPREKLVPDIFENITRMSSAQLSGGCLKQDTAPSYSIRATGTYIKSFSQDSDETQVSQSTDLTVEYISTHGMMGCGSEVEEDDEDDESMERQFIPCPLFEPFLSVGGKLTLDSVKIDCSDFLS